jgi:predicted  nucleic acid-binding Zn-ribbon protein
MSTQSSGVQPSGVHEKLLELQQQAATLEAGIAGSNKELAALREQIAPLSEFDKQLTGSQSGAQKEREAATKVLNEAGPAHDSARARLENQLTRDVITKIAQGRDAINGEITTAENDLKSVQKSAKDAAGALVTATANVKAQEATSKEVAANQNALPDQIKGAAGEAQRLQKELESVAKAGNLRRAYYLVLELGAAITKLRELNDPQEEARRTARLNEESAKLTELQKTAANARKDAGDKADVEKAAQTKLNDLNKKRAQRIDDLLSDNGKGQTTPAAQTGAAAQTAAQAPPVVGATSS